MENSVEVSRKLNIELPYDPTIPPLGIYPYKTFLGKDTCTHMFIAALFTIAKTWKQPKCPSTDEWIKKMWYIYTVEQKKNKIVHKKEQNNAICSNMDGTRASHTKWSKSERERQIPYDITYMWNLKCGTNEPICKTETDSQTWRTDWWVAKGEKGGSGMDWESGVSRCKLLHLECISSEVLLYIQGTISSVLG